MSSCSLIKTPAIHILQSAKNQDLFPRLHSCYYRRIFLEALKILPTSLPQRRRVAVSIYWTDDEEIKMLNKTYRNKDVSTNILAFNLGGTELEKNGRVNVGELIVSRETAAREALEKEWSEKAYLLHLLGHGFVHLLGYDHEELGEAMIMEAWESKILKACGLPDPYAG